MAPQDSFIDDEEEYWYVHLQRGSCSALAVSFAIQD